MRRTRYCVGATAAALALVFSGCGGSDEPTRTPGSRVVTEQQLKTEAASIDYPIYWLGPIVGRDLELTKRSDGRIYVRYIPIGAEGGTKDRFLTVGTYPMQDAYKVVKSISEQPGAKSPEVKNGVSGATQTKPESVYVAFRGKDLQIEVYDPNAVAALRAVSSGELQPIK